MIFSEPDIFIVIMHVGLSDSYVTVRSLEEEEVPYFVSKVCALSE